MIKNIFLIDWLLIPSFIFSLYTGIELHVAGHGNNHEIWHNWAVFHVVMSLLFFIFGICHIMTHWNWYKGIVNKGVGKKSRITLCLSVLFVLVTVTGIVLLCIDGANSNIGLWHYYAGLLTGVLSIIHILKRIPMLSKLGSRRMSVFGLIENLARHYLETYGDDIER